MKHKYKILLSLIIISLFISCNTTEPPNDQTISLELEDVSCTEAWIKLTTNNLQLPATINLLKNNTVAQSFSLNSRDSLLYIDSLLPNQNYKFLVTMQQLNYRSNELSVTTMDTTSHEFSWQSWEFGECSSSSLYDVAIIDENNIWAVGEIYMRDSLGNCDPNAYNAVHWDGTKWELKRIPYVYNGQIEYPSIRAIYAFNENNIWFGIASLIHWNGVNYNSINTSSFFPALINKMWGSSSSDLYIVGNNGNIAHWDGVRWRKIESGTELNFRDIYGIKEPKNGNTIILTVCSKSNLRDRKIYSIEGEFAKEIDSKPIDRIISGVWFVPDKCYYLVGDGIYKKKNLSDSNWEEIGFQITNNVTPAIRGNDANDVFIVGAFGECLHFNGFSWKSFREYTAPSSAGGYVSVAVKNRTVAAVGYTSRQAIILLGKRTN